MTRRHYRETGAKMSGQVVEQFENPSGIYVANLTNSVVDDLLEGLVGEGLVVAEVEGSRMTTEADVFQELSTALEFPDSGDARTELLDEHLADLNWLPTKRGYVIAIHDPAEVMADDSGEHPLTWFVDRMNAAIQNWSAPVEGRVPERNRPAYPFVVILIDPMDESQATDLWQAAGAEVRPLTSSVVRQIRGVEHREPPPYGSQILPGPYASPVPFGNPPPGTVELVGEIPWELRDGD
jgi:Barstar (barnase inhibitor)